MVPRLGSPPKRKCSSIDELVDLAELIASKRRLYERRDAVVDDLVEIANKAVEGSYESSVDLLKDALGAVKHFKSLLRGRFKLESL